MKITIMEIPSNSLAAEQQRIKRVFRYRADELHLTLNISFKGWILYIDGMQICDIRKIYDICVDRTLRTPSIAYKIDYSDDVYLLDYGMSIMHEYDWYEKLAGVFKINSKTGKMVYIENRKE